MMGIFRFCKHRRRRGAFLSEADRAAFFRWGRVCSGYYETAAAAAGSAPGSGSDGAASAAGAAAGAAVRYQNERTHHTSSFKQRFPSDGQSIIDNSVVTPAVKINSKTRRKEATSDRDSS